MRTGYLQEATKAIEKKPENCFIATYEETSRGGEMPKNYVSNKDESARLFKNDFLELFTHVHWSVPIILYMPVIIFFLNRTASEGVLGLYTAGSLFVFGLFVWTLTEYLLHRFIFHYEPRSDWGKRLHFFAHGVHHDYPNDSKRLVLPPSVSIPLAAAFYGLYLLVFGDTYVSPFYAGFILGYVCYDTIHYATHHAPMKGRFALWVKHHHILHHYQDNGKGYGVSSPLWDYVFGTMEEASEQKAVTEN
jgi:sterol desaturase/sphingolipid hydroxylase (fatty acid hydroxylase superfamily)